MDAADRARLRQMLGRRFPWVTDTELGPAAVEAGECDRCGEEARIAMTCGPIGWPYLGRRCLDELGAQAWCDGHAEHARQQLARAAALPPEADTVARLWWVGTGEVGLDASWVRREVTRLGLAP